MVKSALHKFKQPCKFVKDIALSVVRVIASGFGLAMPACGMAWLFGWDLKLIDFGKQPK